jgi:hypothetical protein
MSSLAEEVAGRLAREAEAGGRLDANKWREEITRAHKAATSGARSKHHLGSVPWRYSRLCST